VLLGRKLCNNLGQVVHTYVPLAPSKYNLVPVPASGKVTAGLAENNGSLPLGGWILVTCGLTACTPVSGPGPALSNEYGKPFHACWLYSCWCWVGHSLMSVCLFVLAWAIITKVSRHIVLDRTSAFTDPKTLSLGLGFFYFCDGDGPGCGATWGACRYDCLFFRSTPLHWPNKVGLKCPSVHWSTKSFFDFSEIWYVGRGRWVMHDGMQYDPIQSQGHEPLKVGNSAIFNGCLLPHL